MKDWAGHFVSKLIIIGQKYGWSKVLPCVLFELYTLAGYRFACQDGATPDANRISSTWSKKLADPIKTAWIWEFINSEVWEHSLSDNYPHMDKYLILK